MLKYILNLFSGVRFAKGNFIFDNLQRSLGVNDVKVEAYPYQKEKLSQIWTADQVDTDSEEHDFERITLDSKLPTGSWPFSCEKIIPCNNLKQQTCGCDYYMSDDSKEKMGIVYNVDSESMTENLNFRSCEELQTHGVTINGYFLINGEKKYCSNWSKFIYIQQ